MRMISVSGTHNGMPINFTTTFIRGGSDRRYELGRKINQKQAKVKRPAASHPLHGKR